MENVDFFQRKITRNDLTTVEKIDDSLHLHDLVAVEIVIDRVGQAFKARDDSEGSPDIDIIRIFEQGHQRVSHNLLDGGDRGTARDATLKRSLQVLF